MFYVCLNGKGTECEYLNSEFNYQSALPLQSRADLSAAGVKPASLTAAEGRCGGAALSGEQVLSCGEPGNSRSMAGLK